MQRWILLGLVAAVILLSAAGGGLWLVRQNRPVEQWVPMPVNTSASKEERDQTLQEIKRLLTNDSVLQRTVKDMNLDERFGLNNDEAVARLKGSIFVREGEFKHPMTQESFPTIDIGVSGKSKEKVLLGEISIRLAKETRILLGIPEAP